ncbi:MAG TPA: helix-turn-helix domain-containing protein, partial [Planctomycetota bacterium]|nr:helix-turn-helix domain-containing protein [Planctomycetota bacterium]
MNLDARAAARLLCVSEDRIYEWVAGGVLPSFTVQEELRFNRIELLEWATARRMRIAPELFQEQRPRSEAGTFLLSRAL